ncbi:MAG: glycosyltransferase family 39 protein [Candidatus Rokubacteria bacterium]|nr:glycosyltransferase family 39 protein [Candidatus Rokubacteria bacterium]MBI1963382.1 glycosyltransferase family 39 protein [Candidatus Rokubacteria bacterium]
MPYLDKPPLLYALAALAFALRGEGEGTARAVPALAALLAVGATAWLGARLLGGRAGFVAGTALLTSAGFFAFGRYVRPETLFVALLAGGFALALTGLAEERRGRVIAGLVLFGTSALAKDPLGALAPPLAIGLALALAGRARPIGRWLAWPGVLALAALAFGWWLPAEMRTPGFVWYTVVDNHVLNAVGARRFPDEDVPLSAGEFLAVGLLGAVPWIIPAALTVWSLARRRAWREPREMPWVVLALWAVGVFAATALSSFRLPHYGLPAYFAIALLAARGWDAYGGRAMVATHALLFAVLALACALAWGSDGARFMDAVLGATDIAARKSAAAGQEAPLPAFVAFRPLLGAAALVFAAGGLALGGCAAAFNRLSPRVRRLVPPFAVAAVMLATLPSVSAALSLVASHRSVSGLGRELGRRAESGDVVVHEGPIESSGALEWYSGRRPVIVDGRRSILAFGALRPEARDLFWDAARLGEAWLSGRRVWVVSVRPAERSVVASLPGAQLVGAAAGRSLWVNEPR